MTKKLILAMAVLLLLSVPAFGQTVVNYTGGQVIVRGGGEQGIGAGTVIGLGNYIGDKFIAWGEYKSDKWGDTPYDYVLTGFTIFTDPLIKKANMGFYFSPGIGGGKEEGEPSKFSVMMSGGFYFEVKPKVNLYLGGGYSYIDTFGAYSVQFGMSVPLGSDEGDSE